MLHLAVRHVLHGIEVLVLGGNLDTALPTGRTVVITSARVIECTTVDSEVIVVETFVHRSGCGAHP